MAARSIRNRQRKLLTQLCAHNSIACCHFDICSHSRQSSGPPAPDSIEPTNSMSQRDRWAEAKRWVQSLGLRLSARTKIGAGSFGSVHTAECCTTGQVVAVKFSRCFDPAWLAKEVAVLQELQRSPCEQILSVFDFCRFEGLLTQFVEVSELAMDDVSAWLQKQHILPELALTFAQDMAAGVSHLHSLQIWHRDLKPANLLIFARPSLRIKVADFGACCFEPVAAAFHALPGTLDAAVAAWF